MVADERGRHVRRIVTPRSDLGREPMGGDMTGPGDSGQASPDACLRCGAELESMGVEAFRVGGTTGGWKLLFGEFAELGEGMLQLEVRACGSCRQVELRVPANGE